MAAAEIEKARARVSFALRKLEDVCNHKAALLGGATVLSEAGNLMASASEMLEEISLGLVCISIIRSVRTEEDADSESEANLKLEEWLTSVRSVGLHIERVTLQFLEDAGKDKPASSKEATNISTKPVDLVLLDRLIREMGDINCQLQEIKSRLREMGENIPKPEELKSKIQEMLGHGARLLPVSVPDSVRVRVPVPVYGSTHEEKIIEMLLDSTRPQLVEIPIFGPWGDAGKSTLALNIYQSVVEKKNFEICFWLFDMTHVDFRRPELSEPTDILRQMLTKLESGKSLKDKKALNDDDEDGLVSEIKDYLMDKKYLVVIDNAWRYKIFRKALPNNNKGSRVMIVSHPADIYNFGIPDSCYPLPPLTEEERLKLIFREQFEKKDSLKDLDPAATKIAACWGNSPMMLVLLGRHLLFNQPFSNIRQFTSNIAAATSDETFSWVYNKLPSVLQTCFAYMAALYPVNYPIHSASLIRLWITEGIVPEETAQLCLDELINRGFLHVIWVYYHNQKNQRSCVAVIHPRLQSRFFHYCTGKNNCPPIMVILEGSAPGKSNNHGKSVDDNTNVEPKQGSAPGESNNHGKTVDDNTNFDPFHRLAFQNSYKSDQFSSFDKVEPLPGFNRLHSLFFFGSVAPLQFSVFGFLRVLAVFQARIEFSKEDGPCWLDDLINLRYLGFILCWVETGTSLGQKLKSLKNLQTLDLSESFISGFSDLMVHNTNTTVIGPIKEELKGCWSPIPDVWEKTGP